MKLLKILQGFQVLAYLSMLQNLNSCILRLNPPTEAVSKTTVSKMNYRIMKDLLTKTFTCTSSNVHNKTKVDKIDVKP